MSAYFTAHLRRAATSDRPSGKASAFKLPAKSIPGRAARNPGSPPLPSPVCPSRRLRE